MKNKHADDLREIAARLRERSKDFKEISAAVSATEAAARHVGKSFSGSALGYHSRTYYRDFSTPPAGARFNSEWGLMLDRGIVQATRGLSGSIGDWHEYTDEMVNKEIAEAAGNPKLSLAKSKAAFEQFQEAQSEVSSIMSAQRLIFWDEHLERLANVANSITVEKANEIAARQTHRSNVVCRDTRAVNEGYQVPPHIMVLAKMTVIRNSFSHCDDLADVAEKIASHLKRIGGTVKSPTNKVVFIGHGRSLVWYQLKDFLKDKLNLPVEEFNSSSPAGKTVTERLSEMLDASAFAFLVMTGEDENLDGKIQARLNVVHEIGLFQGRLGFKRAIVLLEQDCEEFSNIHGLTQIRFPKSNINSKLEEIREVLIREKIIERH